jgi:hypothetical protein
MKNKKKMETVQYDAMEHKERKRLRKLLFDVGKNDWKNLAASLMCEIDRMEEELEQVLRRPR